MINIQGRIDTNVQGRMRDMMRQSEFDAVVLSQRENVLYLAGVRNLSHDHIPTRHHYVVWPRQGDPTYICIGSELGLSRIESPIADIRTYREFSESAEDLVVKVLKEKGLDGKHIGMELRGITKEMYEQITRQLPSNRIDGCDDFMYRVRAIKTKEEVALLRYATEATERAIRSAFSAAREGDTERDIHNSMAKALIDAGCENVAWLTLAAGKNAHVVHPKASSSYRIAKGDIVWVDVGAWFGGYLSDIGRVAVVGAASERQKLCYAKLMRTQDRVIASVKPGRTFKQLYFTIVDGLKDGEPRVNLPSFPHFGHLLGIGVHEEPMITATTDVPLEPGMVVCIEPCFVDANGDIYHDEELVVVTESGYDLITPRHHWKDFYVIQ